jgi:hypothetical protein
VLADSAVVGYPGPARLAELGTDVLGRYSLAVDPVRTGMTGFPDDPASRTYYDRALATLTASRSAGRRFTSAAAAR